MQRSFRSFRQISYAAPLCKILEKQKHHGKSEFFGPDFTISRCANSHVFCRILSSLLWLSTSWHPTPASGKPINIKSAAETRRPRVLNRNYVRYPGWSTQLQRVTARLFCQGQHGMIHGRFFNVSQRHLTSLKEQCHKIFQHFFHESNPPEPLIKRIKWFCKLFRFHGDTNKNKNIYFVNFKLYSTILYY